MKSGSNTWLFLYVSLCKDNHAMFLLFSCPKHTDTNLDGFEPNYPTGH